MRLAFLKPLLLFSLLLIAPACNNAVTVGGPEVVAEAVFEEYARNAGVPYRDVTYQVISNDGTFATVSVTAEFRQSAESEWVEQATDIEVRNVGGDWQSSNVFLNFRLSQAEVEEREVQRLATASVQSAMATTQSATVTAVQAELDIRATATQEAWLETVALVEVSNLTVDYEWIPINCDLGGANPGCRYDIAQRIYSFTVTNNDVVSHYIRILINTSEEYSSACVHNCNIKDSAHYVIENFEPGTHDVVSKSAVNEEPRFSRIDEPHLLNATMSVIAFDARPLKGRE